MEAVVDSGAEESAAKPNVFLSEIRASTMSKVETQGADGTCIPNLSQQRVRVRNDEGHVCGMALQISDVERSLTTASQMAAGGNRVTFKAQGGEIEHIQTGRKMTLVRRQGIFVLRMWIATRAQGFPGPKTSVWGTGHEAARQSGKLFFNTMAGSMNYKRMRVKKKSRA